MDSLVLNLLIVTALSVAALYVWIRAKQRSAIDVIYDLGEVLLLEHGIIDDQHEEREKIVCLKLQQMIGDELGKMGLYAVSDREIFKFRQRFVPLIIALLPLIYILLFSQQSKPATIIFFAASGFLIGKIYEKYRGKKLRAAFRREMEFYLPIVMERMVMAVQSGMDILPAVKTVLELEKDKSPDPVTRLLRIAYQLTEAGLSFEVALNDVAELIECPALRHAFMHLALAQKEGGELITPLRELSDSTQLYFQETVEEEIAKLPVKATVPLLVTFAGLMIFFVTAPIIQIVELAKKNQFKNSELEGGKIR